MVLTGSDDEAILGAAMALDCDAFVKKNVGPSAIKERINKVLTEKAATKDPSSYHSVTIPEVIMDMPPPEKVPEPVPSAQAQEIPAMEIKAGMIVDCNFYTEDGFLLVEKGTEITKSHVDRVGDLSEILNLRTVWVRYS
jgi:hypothetical protein